MSGNYQNEVPSARASIQLDFHIEGAQKKIELPLKIAPIEEHSQGGDDRLLSENSTVAKKILSLRSLLAMCNLFCDLKSNFLDNAVFFHELRTILKGNGVVIQHFRRFY